MQPEAITEEQHPQPKVWALSMLAEMLKAGPPQLDEIIHCLEGIGDIKKFVAIVQMLMPESEQEIMSKPRNRRIYQFVYNFGQKYYPLPANTDISPKEWIRGIPVELLGLSYTAYHDQNMRPGFMMLLALCPYPFEGDARDNHDDDIPFDPFDPMKSAQFLFDKENFKPSAKDVKWTRQWIGNLAINGEWVAPAGFKIVKVADNKVKITNVVDTPEARETLRKVILCAQKAGIEVKVPHVGQTARQKMVGARMPYLDVVARIVGAEMAGKIPKAGWTPEELHKMTDRTIYDGVGLFADWACANTGCIVLDSNYDDCDFADGEMGPLFKWTKKNVDILTEQYPIVKEIRKKMDHIVAWLEEDQASRFTGLLDLCIKNSPAEAHKRRKVGAYRDPMERMIELEQNFDEEDDEDED
jgi:hypothetical protein